MPKNHKNDPVLQLNDKYFGNFWADYADEENDNVDDERIRYILFDPNSESDTELFCQQPEDVAENITYSIGEIEKVEKRLTELTGIPALVPTLQMSTPDESDSEGNSEAAYYRERDGDMQTVMTAAIEHRRGWITKGIQPSDPTSPFAKLPTETVDMILECCCYSLSDEIDADFLEVCRLRNNSWDDWVKLDAEDLVWEGVKIAEFMFAKWKLLREELVKKYEATEETKKEWEELRAAGELPY